MSNIEQRISCINITEVALHLHQQVSLLSIALCSLWWELHADASTSDMAFLFTVSTLSILKMTALDRVFSFTPITLEGDCLASFCCHGVWPGIVCTGVDKLFTGVQHHDRQTPWLNCASLNACLNSNFASANNLPCILRSWIPKTSMSYNMHLTLSNLQCSAMCLNSATYMLTVSPGW